MSEQQFKRNISYKLRIGDLLSGKMIAENEKFQFLEFDGKKIARVNIIGNIVDKYQSDGEKKFIFIKLDDGSGQIQVKAFGDEMEKLKEFSLGETILIIGRLKYWNNETYLSPEIIKEQEPKYLLLRKLETEKERKQIPKPIAREEIIALKDKILEMIRGSEQEGGVEIEKIIMKIRDVSPETINEKIQKMIEDGIIFEPRPGK